MTLPDLDHLTLDQLRELAALVSQRLGQLEQDAAATETEIRADLGQSVDALTALLGPDDAPPGLDSITAVRRYSQTEMHTNAGLGLQLAFHALDILTRQTRDMARILGT